MKEIRHLKTMKNKRNLNTKWLLLQNDQNADTTLLHSHDVFLQDNFVVKRFLFICTICSLYSKLFYSMFTFFLLLQIIQLMLENALIADIHSQSHITKIHWILVFFILQSLFQILTFVLILSSIIVSIISPLIIYISE